MTIYVKIETNFGDITMQLFPEKAPLTVANFLEYTDRRLYDGTSFFRIVKRNTHPLDPVPISVIQGGLQNDDPRLLLPVSHEDTNFTGLLHLDGTLSMARGDVGTARGSFFICIGEQPALDFGGKRQPDGQGFAAFGQVIIGMENVRNAWAVKTVDEAPVQNLSIKGITRLTCCVKNDLVKKE